VLCSSTSDEDEADAFSGDAAGDNGRREDGACAVFILVGGGAGRASSATMMDAEDDELDEGDLGRSVLDVEGEKNRIMALSDDDRHETIADALVSHFRHSRQRPRANSCFLQ
jgi:hypothetical protein